jgi:hypothetical protein
MHGSLCILFSTWNQGRSPTAPSKRYHFVTSPHYLRKEPSSKLSCILNLGYFIEWAMSTIVTQLTKRSNWILKELSLIPLHSLKDNDCTATLLEGLGYWKLHDKLHTITFSLASWTKHFVNICVKTNKCNNYSFNLLIMYGSSYMFRHYIAILKERP